MQTHLSVETALPPATHDFYKRVLEAMERSQLPYLVGGAYALQRYTGIERHTKDLDLFVRREHAEATLDVLAAAGYSTEMTFPHWLGKAYQNGDFIDLIFGSGNGLCPVDDDWFAHARTGLLFAISVKLCPPEEMIWSKSFIMERERFDGADIAHLLRACADDLDWPRLVRRFGRLWPVFLCHLLLFRFIYPDERHATLEQTLWELLGRSHDETAGGALCSSGRLCQGTLLSREQYLTDVENWGYEDARLACGVMTPAQIERWTRPIRDVAP